jgi:tetratricopeptide (TPR) repeat protein
VYAVAGIFEKKVQLQYALQAYELALSLEPKFNFNYQMGLIYGQLGNTDMMIDKFLTEAYANQQNSLMIQNQLSRFLTEDSDVAFNEALKKHCCCVRRKTRMSSGTNT